MVLLPVHTREQVNQARWVYEGAGSAPVGMLRRLTAAFGGVLQGVLADLRGTWPLWYIPGWLLLAVLGRFAQILAKSPGWLSTFKGGTEKSEGVFRSSTRGSGPRIVVPHSVPCSAG